MSPARRATGDASEPLRVGLAGAGVFGGHHASKLSAHPDVLLAGVYDVDPGAARALAERVGAPPVDRWAALLEACDAVVVAAPASVHFALARDALAAGRHALVEKPLALDLREADALIALATAGGLVLQVGHQERIALAGAGLPGRPDPPRSIRAERVGPPSGRGLDVGVTLDLMIHDLDIVRALVPGEPLAVAAEGGADEVRARLAYEGGTRIELVASRARSSARRTLALRWADGERLDVDFAARRATRRPPEGAAHEATLPADPLRDGTEEFVRCVRGGREPLVSGADGRGALDLALRVERAARDSARLPAPRTRTHTSTRP